ncbi:hypothetical protein C8J56DRAFT_977612 [Mycena floridula]|nr:hypothetical protein C8J56DRAFT_977612 [Mycena floridula]
MKSLSLASVLFAGVVLLQGVVAAPLPLSDDATLEARADWSTNDAKYKQTGKLTPQPGVTGPHTTFRQGGTPKHTTNYQSWEPNANPKNPKGGMVDAGRWRGDGKGHGGVQPPIMYPAAQGQPKQPARPATGRENPPSYDHAKFSQSLAGKSPKPGLSKSKTW